jgi:hypothetical protein
VSLVGIARFEFRDGDVDEFKRLSAQAMEIVRDSAALKASPTGSDVVGLFTPYQSMSIPQDD